MSDSLRRLDQLKADYEAARRGLDAARNTGQLAEIDVAQERFSEAEVAYHEAIYERSPGMSGDDRTAAARALARTHEAQYRVYERESAARERVDDLGQEFTTDVVEDYQRAVDERRSMDLPEPDHDWNLDLEAERNRDDPGREIDGYEP